MKALIFIAVCMFTMASTHVRAAYTHLSSEVVVHDAINGYVTVRVYVHFSDPSDQLNALYGNNINPMSLSIAGGQFYQHPAGGGTALSINPAFFPFVPELAYDSWITIGDEDQVSNVMSSLGVNYSSFESGGNLSVSDPAGAGLFVNVGSAQCFPNGGKVLIAQLTINADVQFTCNLEWRDGAQVVYQSVSQVLTIQGGVPGCNDPYAENYDPSATFNDGSCIYLPPGYNGLEYELVGHNLIDGYSTYRVFALFTSPFDQVAALYGQDVTPLTISTTGQFYQHPAGTLTSDGIDESFFGLIPELEYDSWVTIGRDSGPNGVETINMSADSFESGGSLSISDSDGGAWYILPDSEPTAFPDAQGRVLIAQLTASGDVSLLVNLQYRSADGSSHQELAQTLFIPFLQDECPGDFTSDGLVGSADLLIFLAGFGCTNACNADLTGDGQVGTSDLLLFLSLFGTSCTN